MFSVLDLRAVGSRTAGRPGLGEGLSTGFPILLATFRMLLVTLMEFS